MALAAAMFAGITGLSAHGEKMSVIGDNIANVNTVAFKSSNMYFENVMGQDINTAAGVAQVGRGVRIGAIYTDFAQGSYETTSEATDLAIGGDGFFVVSPEGEDGAYYTRAGDFRFNSEGYLVDTHGYIVQGWAVDNSEVTTATTTAEAQSGTRITGVPVDIQLANFQVEPKATSELTMITNLDSDATSLQDDQTDPFFALGKNWNGSPTWTANNDPIDANSYSYESTITVYDANGSSHDVTVFFDPVTLSNSGGKMVWEYIVTCEPTDDGRFFTASDGSTINISETSAAGLLMMGTMTFDSAGQMQGMTGYTLDTITGAAQAKDLNSWTLADFSSDGYPQFTANFLKESNASITGTSAGAANTRAIKLDFGLRNTDTSNTYGGWDVNNPGQVTAAGIGNITSNVGALPNFDSPQVQAQTSTSYAAGSATLYQDQDGYTAGFLSSVSVSQEGVLTGKYTNGETLDLYVITLATFTNEWGLRSEGGNLYSQTKESGAATTNRPNTAGTGTVEGNTLEMSNVDLSSEFVDMITTQRGFQANTKVVTTTDSMLGDVISMKR